MECASKDERWRLSVWMCLDSVSSKCIRLNVNTRSRHLLKPVCILTPGPNRRHTVLRANAVSVRPYWIKPLKVLLYEVVQHVISSSSYKSRLIVWRIFKQSCGNSSYQNCSRFYLGLWYLSSLLEHDSNYCHQRVRLEPSAKSVYAASPQLIGQRLLTSALRLFKQSLKHNEDNRRQGQIYSCLSHWSNSYIKLMVTGRIIL